MDDCKTNISGFQNDVFDEFDEFVGIYFVSDECSTCDGSGELAGNYFAEDRLETCRDCGGKGHGVALDESDNF